MGLMRRTSSRAVALAVLATMLLPILPAELLGAPDRAGAQAGLGAELPAGISWQDWEASHVLHAGRPLNIPGSASACTADPNAPNPPVPGDRKCQLPLNTTARTTGGVPERLVRATLQLSEVPPTPTGQPVNAPDAKRAWLRLEPAVAHPLRVSGLSGEAAIAFQPPLQSCRIIGGELHEVRVEYVVRALPSGEQGEVGEAGQVIGQAVRELCPADDAPSSQVGDSIFYHIAADIPVTGGTARLLESQKLQLTILVGRSIPTGSTWIMGYNSTTADTTLTLRSPDAIQFAAWMEDQNRRITNVFAVPVAPGDRFSAVGFFAYKTALGGYDNPPANSTPPSSKDAKWTMKVLAPNGEPVSLRDAALNPDPGEFEDCDGNENDFLTCLEQADSTPDVSVRIFRMPPRPLSAISAPVWNYTQARINEVSPGGGEFKVQITGGVRGNRIETRLAEGIKFTVGGFGVRLAAVRVVTPARTLDEVLSHQVAPGQSTTFLLNITNIAPKADNFTLTSEVLSCSPSNPPCSAWSVAFGGRDVKGPNVAFVEPQNASLLKVTVTPPSGGTSAVIRVTARSQSAPDQFSQVQLSVQVSSTLLRGAGVFLFPEPPAKVLRRGERVTFNYTIWNRGTDVDSFNVNCDQGPDLSVNDVTLQRNDDRWNGSIALGGSVLGCRDINATRALVATMGPGDTREAQVVLETSFSNTGLLQMRVVVKAESQKDMSKSDKEEAIAQVELRSSFKLLILTDGTADPEEPQSPVSAGRLMRFGKDQRGVCPDPANPAPDGSPCQGNDNTENVAPYVGEWNQEPVLNQKVDANFSEYAFYRVTIVNDGDKSANFFLRLGEIKNATSDPSCGDLDSFTASGTRIPDTPQGVGMNDKEGILLLRRPTFASKVTDEDKIGVLPVPAGKIGVFYLRVHNEWNRYNISQLGRNPLTGVEGPVCNSQSRVTVIVTSDEPPFPRNSVIATTQSRLVAPNDPSLSKNLVITQGRRQTDNIFDADFRQSCPPVTPADSPDRVYCKYVRPGQIVQECLCSVSWFFTVSKFWGQGDNFVTKPLRRVGGLSITDLVNRGWRFSQPAVVPEDLGRPPPNRTANTNGDEITLRADVTVPANATVSDFAGLQLEVGTQFSGASQSFSFYTIGAQKFKVNVTNLARGPVEIHPGDRAALNLNISNEGAAVDIYNITLVGQPLPQGWSVSFQPNETRVSPSRNKTVTVFLHSPADHLLRGLSPTVTATFRVSSVVNLSKIKDETFQEVTVQVKVLRPIADNVALTVQGTETRPIDNGGSLTFTLNVSNPAPNELKFVLQRLPEGIPEFVDGWLDSLGESCFDIAAKATKQVSFTITAAADALEGTHVSYVLRADDANSQCQPLGGENPNFAQAIVTATVIGVAGLEVQPLDPVKVVPRGSTTSFPVRVRNVGTGSDTFVFQVAFVNQSQALPPAAWSAEVRTAEGQAAQSLLVDPQTSRIVFLHVNAPLNIPFTGVRSDIDFTVRGTVASPGSVRLTAFVQDYDIRIRLTNNTVDAFPGQTLFFTLNITNAGNGIDTMDIVVDIGTLLGFWNVTAEFSAVTLLNGTSKDIQVSVQVPKVPLPTTGAVIGITVRSRQVEAIRPQVEALGAGSPLVSLLNAVPKTSLISVNLLPYVGFDVDGDREPEIAVDRNRNPLDGFEVFVDPFTAIIQAIDLLSADGDDDGRIDHFVDTNTDGRPERYWDPDNGRVTQIGFHPDVNNDDTREFLYDSDADLAVDRWIDPATRRSGDAIEKDFDDDGNPEFLIDTNGDGRFDKYYDQDRGPRGLVTSVEPAPTGNPQQYAIDTSGGGRPTKVYDAVTGEVSTASFVSIGSFLADFWYLVLLFVLVAVLAAYLVMQRRKGRKPGGEQGGEGPPR